MLYSYFCSTCQNEIDISKPHTESSNKEVCPDCKLDMERIYSAPQIAMKNWEAAYNPAFGKVIHNRRELNETLSEYKGETGVKLVEVGTDKLTSVKKRFHKYEW